MVPPEEGVVASLHSVDDAVVVGLDMRLLPDALESALLHVVGHLALGHVRPGDKWGHWDTATTVSSATPHRVWDQEANVNTLVIDVTNFSPKTDFMGSRENLHLVERWTRTSPTSLEYAVTIEDPTVWTRPWTAKVDFTQQSEEQNRIYYEPRCNEGNFGLPGLLHGRRIEERAFAEGQVLIRPPGTASKLS
jgi:hypothetical protein